MESDGAKFYVNIVAINKLYEWYNISEIKCGYFMFILLYLCMYPKFSSLLLYVEAPSFFNRGGSIKDPL